MYGPSKLVTGISVRLVIVVTLGLGCYGVASGIRVLHGTPAGKVHGKSDSYLSFEYGISDGTERRVDSYSTHTAGFETAYSGSLGHLSYIGKVNRTDTVGD